MTAKGWEGRLSIYVPLRYITARKEVAEGLAASKKGLERQVKERTRRLSSLNGCLLGQIETRKNFERELKKSRIQLGRLSGRRQKARGTERTRAVREVHDELGQSFSALKIDLTCPGYDIPEDSLTLREQTKTMGARIDDAINTVRGICSWPCPPTLDRFGLPPAPQWCRSNLEGERTWRAPLK